MTGQQLRRARLRMDLEQKELAHLLGVAANTISRYENESLKVPKTVELAVKYLELQLAERTSHEPRPASESLR
jgi:transcriptional regulator with XRE-family HTH domain